MRMSSMGLGLIHACAGRRFPRVAQDVSGERLIHARWEETRSEPDPPPKDPVDPRAGRRLVLPHQHGNCARLIHARGGGWRRRLGRRAY